MHYKIVFIIMAVLSGSGARSQTTDSNTYPVTIHFQSLCCGVPDDAPLKKCISAFKKKFKIKKITAFHIGPMGREGEYTLAFPLTGLNKKTSEIFLSRIKSIAKKMKDRGLATVEEYESIDFSTLPGRSAKKAVGF